MNEIVYVWPYLEWGGVQRYFMGLMSRAAREYQVTAVLPSGSAPVLLGYLAAIGVGTEFLPARLAVTPASSIGERLARRLTKARVEWVLWRTLTRHRAGRTLFHCDLPPWTFFGLLALLSARNPVVVTLHTGLPRVAAWRRWTWRVKFGVLLALPRFELLVANRDMMASLVPYVSARRLARIPIAYSAVDAAEMASVTGAVADRRARRLAMGVPPEAFVVLTAAQFIERKGCRVLLAAARELAAHHPDVVVVWLGPGPLAPAERALVDAAGLADRFRYLTPAEFGATRPEFLGALKAADLFVLPSFEEGMPLALLEAMAMGTAAIATAVNAVPEAVTDGVDGVLVPAGDAHALADAVARLKADNALRERLATRGRERVLTGFELGATAAVTMGAYARLFGRSRTDG